MKRTIELLTAGWLIIGISVTGIVFTGIGCTGLESSPPQEETVWDGEYTDEIQALADCRKSGLNPAAADHQFFMTNKPKIKTVQIMLDSGNFMEKIKAYLKSITNDEVPDNIEIPATERIVGVWYGVDRGYDEAIVYTFTENGRYEWESQGTVKTGTYVIDPSRTPLNIRFEPVQEAKGYSTACQFIDDKTLLIEETDRSIVFFKK